MGGRGRVVVGACGWVGSPPPPVGGWVPHLLLQFIANLRLKQRKDKVLHLKQINIKWGKKGKFIFKVSDWPILDGASCSIFLIQTLVDISDVHYRD